MIQPIPSPRLERLFEEQAGRTPDAVAVVDNDGATTFAELDSAAERLAGAIRAKGIRDGAFIGIHLERSRRYVSSVLAVLKTHAAAVPLPPSYPSGRLHEILSFATLDAIIDDHDSPLDQRLHERILHASDAGTGTELAQTAPANSDQPAFVLCSSGSTGNPKMIVRSHRSFFHRLQWTWNTHPYEPGEVCCQKAHMTTTHAVYELFEPLLRGVPTLIISDREARLLESFWDKLKRQSVTRLLIVPSVLQASLDMPGFTPPPIKVLVLMGEYLHPRLAARTVATFPDTTVIHSIYGSTEASSTLVCNVRESVHRGGELPLGKPISPDVQVHVLDGNREPVAAGSEGMLYIGGPALFSGYFRDPGLSDAAFIHAADGARLYRTNDRVRRTAEGSLEFLGRADLTVKVRGFHVDLQEVEHALSRDPAVGQCAVIAQDVGGGNRVLVGFVSPAAVQLGSVRQALAGQLPDYMLPSRLVALAAFPLTTSGKIDRRKLLEMIDSGFTTSASRDFRSNTERRLAEVWERVLGHADFARDSNFFEAGGTSLKTFSVIARLRDEFGLERQRLPDNVVYRFPTLEGLACHMDEVRLRPAALVPQDDSILITLKSGSGAPASPLFVVSSAGGTLGAYEKVVRALQTTREVIGVRDPFLWAKRDPTAGFRSWVAIYFDAIRKRQPAGPYYLLAYSSAAAFGYEIARQLRGSGAEVALLALVDPLAIDKESMWRFGHWAMRARFMRRGGLPLVRAAGTLRRALPRWGRFRERSLGANDFVLTQEQFRQFETSVRTSREHILTLSALLELNTGLPLALTEGKLEQIEPEQYVDALLGKVRRAAPDVDPEAIEKLIVQYQLQVRSQHHYRLQRFDGTLTLFEPDGPYHGLLASQFKPYVKRLVVYEVPLAAPMGHTRELADRFPGPLRSHYLSMRDDAFAQTLARELEKLL